MKKVLGCIGIILLALLAAIVIVWGKEIGTVSNVHQVGDNPYLYEMEYRASYDLDKLLAADVDGNAALVGYVLSTLTKGIPVSIKVPTATENAGNPAADLPQEHCTSFQAVNAEGGWLFGRNYDFFKSPTLVVHSHPKDGYSSVSVCDLSHLGYKTDKLPVDFKSKLLCIASVYAPMDGMNEKGLCTSIMALPKQAAVQNTGKHIAGTSILMRLWLDRCATVEEALALLETVDVRHDVKAGSGYHYMIADATGDCAVVEFDLNDNWRTLVTRKAPESKYMHVTNHLLAQKYYTEEPDPVYGNPHSKSWMRYAKVRDYMESHNGGVITADEAAECLSEVHWTELKWDNGLIESTQYSNVYDQTGLTLSLHPWNDYDNSYLFGL